MPHAASAQRPSAHAEVIALLDDLRQRAERMQMPEIDRFYEATDQIETITKTYMEPRVSFDWRPYRLTQCEERLIEALHARLGETVTKHALMNALYFDSPDDEPSIKIIDIFVHKIRRKIPNSPFDLQTVWGRGYRLEER